MTIAFTARIASLATTAILCAALTAACGTAEDLDNEDLQDSCSADDARVGSTGDFNTRFHGVAGTVTVVDDCTLRVDDFTYDGTGLDVRVYGSAVGDFTNGVSLSNDLRKTGGYDGDSLTLKLPKGITLDDVGQVSIWCVTAAENFGDATLF